MGFLSGSEEIWRHIWVHTYIKTTYSTSRVREISGKKGMEEKAHKTEEKR